MPRSILIVEDERDLAVTLEYVLQREGYQTFTVHSGEQALATAQHGVDLVLLDLMLPDMSGADVCRQLRMADRTRHIQIILMTARTDAASVMASCGADDWMLKPFGFRELLRRTRATLRPRAWASLAPASTFAGV